MTRNLVIIPARAGSKGVPGKNKRILIDKPLIQFTINAFRESGLDMDLVITTDDEQIKSLSQEQGITIFNRSVATSSDTASMGDVVREVLASYDPIPDIFILLQPTSPLRTSKHILEAWSQYDDNCDAVVSFTRVDDKPEFLFKPHEDGFVIPYLDPDKYKRRQDLPEYYRANGAIYIVRTSVFLETGSFYPNKTKLYVMDTQSSLDIDTQWDWDLVEFVLTRSAPSQ